MTAIRTNLEVSTDARHPNKKSIVEIEITKWIEERGIFSAHITDYEVKQITENEETYEIKNMISNRLINLMPEKINYLSSVLSDMIPENTPEADKREILKKHALLIYVKTDFVNNENTHCVYNTLPENWEIFESN